MISASNPLPVLISAFAEIPGCTAPGRSSGWKLALRGNVRVETRVVDSWLVMTSPVPMAGPAAQLLGWNAILPVWVKFALSEDGCPLARAELPIDALAGGAAMIREAWQGFRAAHSLLCDHGDYRAPTRPDPLPAPAQTVLLSLCEEAGWNAMPRADNAVAVELECRGAFRQASFAPCASGLRAAIQFTASGGGVETEVAEAVTRFLLAAAGEVRMVRPAVASIAGKAVPRFEFLFSTMPSAALLAHAFSALSTASRLAAEEVRALQNTHVAREYLALRGRP